MTPIERGVSTTSGDAQSTMNDFTGKLLEASILREGTMQRINATTSLGVKALDLSSGPQRRPQIWKDRQFGRL